MSANAVLQGDVVLKYFNLGPVGGRGAVVRNMLFAHDVKFEASDVESFEAWPAEKQQLISTGACPIGTLPVCYIGDKIYFGHIPIVRFLAAKVKRMSTQCLDIT